MNQMIAADRMKYTVTYCHLHSDEQLKWFCIEHQIALCEICRTISHNCGHQPCELEHQAIGMSLDIESCLNDMRSLYGSVSKQVEKLKGIREKLHLQVQDTEAKIRTRGSEIKSQNAQSTNLVDKHVECLLRVLYRAEIGISKELEGLFERYATMKRCMKNLMAHTNAIIEHGTPLHIVSQAGNLITRAQHLVQLKLPRIEDVEFIYNHLDVELFIEKGEEVAMKGQFGVCLKNGSGE